MTAKPPRPPGVYFALSERIEAELKERGSRFLAIVSPVREESDATAQLGEIRTRYRDATHHCWAWRTGSPFQDPVQERSSDDGEPAGTAGKPILLALGELSDTLAVVVRWYGGTKLGKGGLARAYGGAVRLALDGGETVCRFPTETVELVVPYDAVGVVKRAIDPPEIDLIDEAYGADATLVLKVARHRIGSFAEALLARGVAWPRNQPGRERVD